MIALYKGNVSWFTEEVIGWRHNAQWLIADRYLLTALKALSLVSRDNIVTIWWHKQWGRHHHRSTLLSQWSQYSVTSHWAHHGNIATRWQEWKGLSVRNYYSLKDEPEVFMFGMYCLYLYLPLQIIVKQDKLKEEVVSGWNFEAGILFLTQI